MQKKPEYERCVLCGKITDVKKSTPISQRTGYIEGGGQLCPECAKSLK